MIAASAPRWHWPSALRRACPEAVSLDAFVTEVENTDSDVPYFFVRSPLRAFGAHDRSTLGVAPYRERSIKPVAVRKSARSPAWGLDPMEIHAWPFWNVPVRVHVFVTPNLWFRLVSRLCVGGMKRFSLRGLLSFVALPTQLRSFLCQARFLREIEMR